MTSSRSPRRRGSRGIGQPMVPFGRALLILTACLAPFAAWPVSMEDDRGRRVDLESPAQRVVSLAPFLTELVFAVGAGDRLVAVSKYSDHPAAARALPRIGDAFSVSLERLVSLRPDLVLSWQSGNDPRVGERLESIGIPVFVLEPREIEDVPAALVRLGRLLGREDAARRRAEAFSSAIDGIRSRYAHRRKVRVFYQIARNPTVTLNGRHMVTAILELCGGVNVFDDLVPVAPAVNREQVLARNPDAILVSSTIRDSSELIEYWSRYPAITASRTGNMYLVDSDLVNRQTPRLVAGARQVCGYLEQARGRLPAD